MQQPKPKPFLLVVLSATLLLQACFPVQNNSEPVTGFSGVLIRSSFAEKPPGRLNDLPRLPFTTIPDTEITLEVEDIQPSISRPQLMVTPKSVFTEHFRIHFTTTGTDAVPRADANGNDIPDFVEEVARAMEYVWDVEINYFGWPAPPPDKDKGGDDRYDIYLEELSSTDVIGYAEPTLGGYIVQGESIIEDRSAYSYISLDNDFDGIEGSISSLDIMRITAAHEFFHAIQFALDSKESLEWIGEATANWMEDEVFDGIDDVTYWLDPVFDSPDTCMASPGDSDDNRWYSMWIYPRYLSENYGHSIVQDIWHSAVNTDGYQIVKDALEARHLDPQVVFQDFLIALLTRDFEEGKNYPTVGLEGKTRPGETFTPSDGVDKLGADYIEILGRGKLTITLLSDQLDGIVVGINGKQSAIFAMPDGTVGVDASDYDHLYLIVINNHEVSFDAHCQVVDYQVEVSNGGEVQYHPLLRPAPNFRRP